MRLLERDFPNDHLSVVCLCNRGDADAASLSRRIADAYLLPQRPEGRPQITTNDVPLSASWAGKWQSRQGFVLSTKVEGSRLIASLAEETNTMSRSPIQSVLTAESGAFRS